MLLSLLEENSVTLSSVLGESSVDVMYNIISDGSGEYSWHSSFFLDFTFG